MAKEIISQSNELVLVESKAARDAQCLTMTQEQAQDALSKAKALVFAMWQGMGIATTEQVAEYYEVSVDTIMGLPRRLKDELEGDGLRTCSGKALKELTYKVYFSSNNSKALLAWTPRAVLRAGMLLRDSDVAKQVRTLLLDLTEVAPKQNDRIRELELELEVAKAKERASDAQMRLMASAQMLELVSPGLAPLLMGYGDKVEAKPVYIDRVISPSGETSDGIGITQVAKYLGFGKNTKAAWAWLESIGKGKNSEFWKQGLAAVTTYQIDWEQLRDLQKQLPCSGDRQLFLGEGE